MPTKNLNIRRIASNAQAARQRDGIVLSKEEIHARQSLGAHIGRIRLIARKCGIDPDEIIRKNDDGSWAAGKMLLENELPPLPPHEQKLVDELREEMEWQELIQGYAKQEGVSEEEIVARITAIAEAKIAEDQKEILEA